MQFLQETVRQELLNRGLSPDKINVIIDEDSQVATFLLYNMSGQIVGYQTYRPGRPKVGQGISPEMAKYFTPDPYGDLGDMPQQEVNEFLNRIENGS